ncbi:energy-coupled thiamine transporter ThiT [Bacillus sp. SL00103]
MNGPIIATPVQGFLDYFVASVVISLSGLFSGLIKKPFRIKTKAAILLITLSVFVASFFRLLTFFISGVFLFSMHQKERQVGFTSLIYNSTYMVPSFIIYVSFFAYSYQVHLVWFFLIKNNWLISASYFLCINCRSMESINSRRFHDIRQ